MVHHMSMIFMKLYYYVLIYPHAEKRQPKPSLPINISYLSSSFFFDLIFIIPQMIATPATAKNNRSLTFLNISYIIGFPLFFHHTSKCSKRKVCIKGVFSEYSHRRDTWPLPARFADPALWPCILTSFRVVLGIEKAPEYSSASVNHFLSYFINHLFCYSL